MQDIDDDTFDGMLTKKLNQTKNIKNTISLIFLGLGDILCKLIGHSVRKIAARYRYNETNPFPSKQIYVASFLDIWGRTCEVQLYYEFDHLQQT